eukprot:TRINITY_DN23595_c0_g1_i1.p1 TRINITY_DN23595_c0_g1~~TRINITY_DN23595_c0_g1_i1.p1  ORF type:complete len:301 (+),score=37.96 TRINITY_DN23595_c0_g1_i1:249-1151(+)
MPLELGLAIVLAIVWSDSCKRHLWESIGPLHHFGCDCRGFRYYRRHDSSGRTFTFAHEPPPDPNDADAASRGILDISIVEVAGPKVASSFVAAQLGDVVQCSLPLVAATSGAPLPVNQTIRLPIPASNTASGRCVRLFLYSRQSHPLGERLLSIARVPLDVTRAVGLHDVTVPFFNCDSKPNGHMRLLLRIGTPDQEGLLLQNLVPFIADAAEESREAEGEEASEAAGQQTACQREGRPIVVFNAGGKACMAVHEEERMSGEEWADDEEGKEDEPKLSRVPHIWGEPSVPSTIAAHQGSV